MEGTLAIVGRTPLLVHSDRGADPLSPEAKAMKLITARRTKSDEDHMELRRLDWAAGLYLDRELGPVVPAWNITKSLIEGARLSKGGASVERAFTPSEVVVPLLYRGPRDVEGLWADERFRDTRSVKVGTSRPIRCRPIFREWGLEVPCAFDESILNPDDLRTYLDQAGRLVGLGDGRKMGFGRYAGTLEVSQ